MGTTPGLNFIYVHFNRLIKKPDLNVIYVNGPGHGGPRFGNGVVQAEGVLSSISFSAPPEFLGEPGHWTPEHFLVAAVASCFVSTSSGITEKSRLGFASFKLDAEGVLGNQDGTWRFTEIKLAAGRHDLEGRGS